MAKVKTWIRDNWKVVAGFAACAAAGCVLAYKAGQENVNTNSWISGPKELINIHFTAKELEACNDITHKAIDILTNPSADWGYKDPPLDREVYEKAVRDSMRWFIENDPKVYETIRKYTTDSVAKLVETECN